MRATQLGMVSAAHRGDRGQGDRHCPLRLDDRYDASGSRAWGRAATMGVSIAVSSRADSII